MKIHLTFDIDWAPDWIIEEVLTILDLKKVKGTFFITHETPLNREIALRGHNLGIHPNFLPGSSHGKNVFEIIACNGSDQIKSWKIYEKEEEVTV